MWGVLGNVATVAQLVGVDAAGLIAKIRQAARTAKQNKDDCEILARRVERLGELLPRLMDPEALKGLDATLQEARDLVVSCQAKGVDKLFNASRTADRFRRQAQPEPEPGLGLEAGAEHQELTPAEITVATNNNDGSLSSSPPSIVSCPSHPSVVSPRQPSLKEKMGGFDQQVKELKHLETAAMKAIKATGDSCKKAWSKVRSSIKR